MNLPSDEEIKEAVELIKQLQPVNTTMNRLNGLVVLGEAYLESGKGMLPKKKPLESELLEKK